MPKQPARAGKSGSPLPGEPVYLAVGFLRRPHGVRGEILMEIYTDFPERLVPGLVLFAGEDHQPVTLEQVRHHNDGLLLKFAGVDTPEAVGRLRSTPLFVTRADRPPLPEGQYYHFQLLGLRVEDEAGKVLGQVVEVLPTGANDVYVVAPPSGGEILLPAIPDVIRQIDLPAGRMVVRPLPGLLDGAEEA